MDADGNGDAIAMSRDPLASAVASLDPESRLKLLRVADDLVMHLRKSELPAPPAPGEFVQRDESGGLALQLQAVPLTPVEDTAILNPTLGVLRIDYKYPPALGDVDHKDSFEYPVKYKKVKGLTFELCQKGDLTDHPQVDQNFKKAIKKLHDKGCDVIIGDCGFMFQFQQDAVTIPNRPSILLLSPLSQLPTLITALGPKKKVAIMTANSKSFEHMLELLKKQERSCGHTSAYSISRAPRDRYVVVGCQDVPYFGCEVAHGEPIVYELAEPGIIKLAQDTLRKHPEVDMFLLECTELPQFTNTLRYKTEKPVYTAITLANMAMSGRLDNPRFGRHKWRREWLEQQRGRMAMRLRREGDPAGAQAAAEGLRDTELMQSIANAPPPQHAAARRSTPQHADGDHADGDHMHVLNVLGQLADL